MWLKEIKNSLVFLCIFAFILGVIYPFFIIRIGKVIFNNQANGNLVSQNNEIIGSLLIGQEFTDDKYFHGRPSAHHYDAMASGGSNMNIRSDDYQKILNQQVQALQIENHTQKKVPVDLIQASGSGLDPDISVMAANYQVARIAKARHLSPQQIQDLITEYKINPILGIFGEPRVNVLKLNIELGAIYGSNAS